MIVPNRELWQAIPHVEHSAVKLETTPADWAQGASEYVADLIVDGTVADPAWLNANGRPLITDLTDFDYKANAGTLILIGTTGAIDTEQAIFALSNSAGTVSITAQILAGGTFRLRVVRHATSANIEGAILAANAAFKIAVTYAGGYYAAAVNGAAALEMPTNTAPTLDRLALGFAPKAGGDSALFGGQIRTVHYLPQRTDAAQLQRLTV